MKKPSVRALTAALLLSGAALAAQAEDKVCLYEHAEYPGYAYTTPASAYEARLLRNAITSGSDVHVNFAVSNGQWLPDRW